MNRRSARHSATRRQDEVKAEATRKESYFLSLDLGLDLFRVETQETVVYNAQAGEAFVSPLNVGGVGG